MADSNLHDMEDQGKRIVATAEDKSGAASKPSDLPYVVSTRTGELAIRDLSDSAGMVNPTSQSTDEQGRAPESDVSAAAGMKEKLKTLLGGKDSLTEGNGLNSMETEQMPGSFEQ
jgi:hypothetical protein